MKTVISSITIVLISLALLFGCGSSRDRPTVILVVVDTLRSDHVGAHGSTLGLTPELDQLAGESVVFDNAVATSSWTRSSVASMLTSRYAGTIGVLGREDAIPRSVVTLPEALQAAGYATLAVSANRNAGTPFGFAQGFDRFETPRITGGYPNDVLIHTAEGVTRRAIELVDEQRAKDSPVFLFLHYVDPHDPYLPHPDLRSEPEPQGRFNGSRKDLNEVDRMPRRDLTDDDIARIRYLYRGEVRYCDDWLGKLWRALEDRGLTDNALLLVTSDHGEGLWDHGFRGHGRDLYEEMIRVPLIVRFPPWVQNARGTKINTPVSLRDLAPTVLELAGIEPPATFEGSSLLPLVEKQSRPRNTDFVFSELDLDRRSLVAVRRGSLKLIENRHAAPGPAASRFFDLDEDPGETSGQRKTPRSAEDLIQTLEAFDEAAAHGTSIRERINADDLTTETLADLRALGYLGGGPASEGELSSVLDFSQASHSAEQLLHGFYEAESGRRWMAAQSTVLLGRSSQHTDWQIEGWIDLDLLEADSLTLSVSVDGGENVTRTVDESGFFLLHGELPPSALPETRLYISCDRDFVPASRQGTADERRLCSVIRSLALR